MSTFTSFQHYFHHQKIAAVYINQQENFYELTLYKMFQDQNGFYQISNQIIQCDFFFQQLGRNYNVGKNSFIRQLDHLNSDLKEKRAIYVRGSSIVLEYTVIRDVEKYINDNIKE